MIGDCYVCSDIERSSDTGVGTHRRIAKFGAGAECFGQILIVGVVDDDQEIHESQVFRYSLDCGSIWLIKDYGGGNRHTAESLVWANARSSAKHQVSQDCCPWNAIIATTAKMRTVPVKLPCFIAA